MARLAVRLSANHPDGVPETNRVIETRVTDQLIENLGLSKSDSMLIFERLVAQVVMMAAFPDVISHNPIDIRSHIALEMRLLASLRDAAEDPFSANPSTRKDSP